MKKIDIGTAYQLEDDWYIRVMLGPFKSKEDADKFALLVGLLEPKEAPPDLYYDLLRQGVSAEFVYGDPPPTLGINVSETIATKDKFG